MSNIILPSFIQEYVPLANKNWFQTGGAARYYAAPSTSQEFCQALTFAHQQKIPITLLGHGANVLISDHGYAGLIIQPSLVSLHHSQENDQVYVTAGAGVAIADLIEYCLDNGITGLEDFSGIPGTVGGSVYINLHYFTHLLSHFLVQATVIERATGTLLTVDNAWFNFGYNQSTLLSEQHYLVDATFCLKTADQLEIAYARGRRTEIIRHRMSRYPKSNTCGSFFRNFHEHEVTLVSNGKKMIFVAYYLDKIGVKGVLQKGNAIVSYHHANMIVTQPGACSDDVIQLAHAMQEKVLQEFGIVPQPECRFIGFEHYPLLRSL